MARLGLKSLYLLALCASFPLSAVHAAGSSAPPKKNDFSTKSFGEDPDQIDTISPDQGDFQQTGSMGTPLGASLPSPTNPSPSVTPPAQPQAGVPAAPPAQPQTGSPAGVMPVSAAPAQSAPVRPAVWPGPRRPAPPPAKPDGGKTTGAGGPDGVEIQNEQLKDAPAPQNARMYSLWAGLSTPLLLPSSNVKTLSLDRAKDLGRIDYERRILGDRTSVPRDPGAVSLGEPPSPAPSEAGGGVLPGSEKGVYIVLEVDVSKTPGRYEDTVRAMSASAGLRVDERFPPSFMDPGRTRVLVHGWLLPERFAQIMTTEGVTRLEVERSAAPPPPDSGGTEVLLGIRIPEGVSPNLALRDTVLRLATDAHFELQGMIGYQAIPKTHEIVMIVSGRVPVRQVGRVMADPSVVKVAPRPSGDSTMAAAAPKKARLADRLLPPVVARHPAFLLVLILLTLFLLGGSSVRRKR